MFLYNESILAEYITIKINKFIISLNVQRLSKVINKRVEYNRKWGAPYLNMDEDIV